MAPMDGDYNITVQMVSPEPAASFLGNDQITRLPDYQLAPRATHSRSYLSYVVHARSPANGG